MRVGDELIQAFYFFENLDCGGNGGNFGYEHGTLVVFFFQITTTGLGGDESENLAESLTAVVETRGNRHELKLHEVLLEDDFFTAELFAYPTEEYYLEKLFALLRYGAETVFHPFTVLKKVIVTFDGV